MSKKQSTSGRYNRDGISLAVALEASLPDWPKRSHLRNSSSVSTVRCGFRTTRYVSAAHNDQKLRMLLDQPAPESQENLQVEEPQTRGATA
jgi:hypothetical protein